MSTLTIRLPDDKHERLRTMARQRGISLNKLMDEMATVTITEHDTFTRFQIRSAKGSVEEGLGLLEKLDSAKNQQGF